MNNHWADWEPEDDEDEAPQVSSELRVWIVIAILVGFCVGVWIV